MSPKRNIVLSVLTQAVASAIFLAVAIGIFVSLRMTRPQPETTAGNGQARRVDVMQAVAVPVRRQWEGYGTAMPRDEADVPAEVTAVVIEVSPRMVVGAQVQAGEVLARLDETDFVLQQQVAAQRIDDLDAQISQLELEETSWQRRLELAQEDVALAEADFDRAKNAYAQQAARQREVDQAKQRVVAAIRVEVGAREALDEVGPRRSRLVAQKAVQDSMVRLAAKNVERCTIRSPLDGIVAAEDIEVGESLVPGKRVAHVVSLRTMQVPLLLPSSARSGVAVGDEVLLSSQGAGRQVWTGRVARISPADDPQTRTMSVYVDLVQDPDAAGVLAPGKFVQGTVTSERPELRWVVPRRSLLGDRLMVVEDGLVRSFAVDVDFSVEGDFDELGVEAEQWAVLADELPKGALVVVNASRPLPDGLLVQPVVSGRDGVTAISTGRRAEVGP